MTAKNFYTFHTSPFNFRPPLFMSNLYCLCFCIGCRLVMLLLVLLLYMCMCLFRFRLCRAVGRFCLCWLHLWLVFRCCLVLPLLFCFLFFHMILSIALFWLRFCLWLFRLPHSLRSLDFLHNRSSMGFRVWNVCGCCFFALIPHICVEYFSISIVSKVAASRIASLVGPTL